MTTANEAIKTMKAALASPLESDFEKACTQENIAALIARIDELEQDARRYEYVVDCDFKAIKKHFKDVDEQTYKANRRAKHDAEMSKKGKT